MIEYIWVTKPRLVFLLTYVALASGMVALFEGYGDLSILLLSTLSVMFGSMGANAITCYIDRDIDAVMERTRRRPIPAGMIRPPEKALYYGVFLVIIAVILAALTRVVWSVFWLLFGVFDNIVIYSALFKRRNPINIIIGSPSGGATVLVTWSAMTGSLIDFTPLFMAMLIVAWTPVHIWSLALRFKEDYERAKVPMLPVVVRESTAIRCIASTSLFLAIFSHAIAYGLGFSLVENLVLLALNVGVVALSLWLLARPSKRHAWILFKYTSPYLGVVFTLFILHSYLW